MIVVDFFPARNCCPPTCGSGRSTALSPISIESWRHFRTQPGLATPSQSPSWSRDSRCRSCQWWWCSSRSRVISSRVLPEAASAELERIQVTWRAAVTPSVGWHSLSHSPPSLERDARLRESRPNHGQGIRTLVDENEPSAKGCGDRAGRAGAGEKVEHPVSLAR